MGCTSSKELVCRNCQAQYSPVRKSHASLPNHSPSRDSSGHHVVALTSTTLGYLLRDPSNKTNQSHEDSKVMITPPQKKSEDFALEVIETKTWSKMIDEKINKIVPKTPVLTPPGEPETINTWELMEGLDDSSSVQPNPPVLPSVSNASDISTVSSFDANKVKVKSALIKEEHDHAKKSLQAGENENVSRSKEKLILYFTSLRGVRKTYEDCCHVRVILKNSGVRVDERDVSMHSGFKDELKELLSDGYNGGLPKVFVGKKYIGGADEIRRFHDEYQLDKVLEGCEMVDDCVGNGGDGGGGCVACADIRFLPCDMCSGSCKIYYEVNSDFGEDEEREDSDCGFQRCPDCNENGLVRCPVCCD